MNKQKKVGKQRLPTGNSLAFSLGEEDQTDHKAGHCCKLMHNTPNAEINSHQRLYRLTVKNGAETAVVAQVMIQIKGKCVNGKGNGKRNDCQGKTLSSHGVSPICGEFIEVSIPHFDKK